MRVRTLAGTRTIMAYTPGCACHVDGRVPGHSVDHNWQQGLGMAEYTADGHLAVVDTEVVEGAAVWRGRLWEARERLEDLRRDIEGWNW
jgi:hypothetical protein